jgi:two-component system sensor histidine kinase KdpD
MVEIIPLSLSVQTLELINFGVNNRLIYSAVAIKGYESSPEVIIILMTRLNPFRRLRAVPGLEYLAAILVTGVFTLIFLPFRTAGGQDHTILSLLYLLPVVLSSVLWGLGPGALVAIASFLALNFFFVPPYYTLLVHRTQDFLVLIVFLGVSITIGQLVGRVSKSLAETTAREYEATHLYELITHLAGLQDEQEIVSALAEQTLITLRAGRVDVLVEAQGGLPARHIRLEDRSQTGNEVDALPTYIAPLQSTRGFLGEIKVWRGESRLSPAEERLLNTFASQGVLALEKVRLSQAASRARLLEDSDKFKSSLLSSVSHELRTPLATIKAAVTSLRSGTVEWNTEARVDLLAAVEEETDHLNLLVGNLLNMSRIEAGALKPERGWNSLAEIVSTALDRTRQQAEKHKIEVDVSPDLPLVPVDYFQIEQVFINLISNSTKYSPEGTVISIRATYLTDDNVLQVVVSNQGPHVAPENLKRIFDKFYRVTAADRVTGAGLGLSICKGIIEAHGGKIWAKNLQTGFAFNFTLPLSWEGFPRGSMPELVDE